MKVPQTEAASDRIAGNHRYATAVEISKNGWSKADTVVLAIGDNFPDALAGGPLAYKLDAPILLSQKNELGAVTRAEVSRLGAKKAIILGSTAVVTNKVENELKGMGLSFERIGGRDRYETAALIAKKLGTSDTAFVAYGQNFPDALAVAPYAARKGIPILLSQTNNIPSATKEQLKGKKNTYVIGGSSILSNSIMSQMPNAKRIAGGGRFSTASAIIQEFQLDANNAYVATGMNFADALTGSVLAAKKNGAILLVEPNTLPEAIKELLNSKKFAEVIALGGKTTVSDQVLISIKDLMKNESITNALPISVNKDYSGSMERYGSAKFYKFNLSKPGNVELHIKNVPGAQWKVEIIDRSGNSYINYYSNDSSYATGTNWAPLGLPAGDHYVKISSTSSSGDSPFTFNVKYKESDLYEKEFNNTATTANAIKLNTIYSGSIQNRYYDQDYFKITLNKPGNLTLKMKNESDAQWTASIMDEQGKVYFSYYTDTGSNATGWSSVDVGLPAGYYYIKITGNNNGSEYATYQLEASFEEKDTFEKEFNNSISTATPIAVNKDYQGTIQDEYNDYDFFKFTLNKAGNIVIKGLLESGISWRYTLYDKSGNEIVNFYTPSNPMSQTRTAIPVGLPAGEYYLRITNSYNTVFIPYKFTIGFTESAFYEKELNNTALTATPINLNNNYYGAIQSSYNDYDYFKFNADTDSNYAFTYHNKYGTYWRYIIYDSSGNTVYNLYTDSGEFAAETTTVNLNLKKGDYFVRVSDYSITEFVPYYFKVSK